MVGYVEGGEAYCDALESEENDDAYGTAGSQSLELIVAVELDMMKLRSGCKDRRLSRVLLFLLERER